MSRIRTVKPDFWVSEQVISCSPLARLLFIGMWNFCDDNGIHPASLVRLKAEVFPNDDHTLEDIKGWVYELITNQLVREYAVDDKSYWIVTGWKKHQRIDRPTYKHPLPLSGVTKIDDLSSNNLRTLDDNSATAHQQFIESSTTEWNGKERKGKDKDICEAEASLVSDNSSDTDVIFSYWQKTMNHPHAKLDNKRKNHIKQALKLGYTVDELKKAIDGCAKTPFNMGQNERKQRYDDLELILRDASHIDRFIASTCSVVIYSTQDIMAGVL